jgi:ParB family chromosome partitioning protein
VRPDKAVHVSHNSGQNEWYTPPEYIEAARYVLGAIDLDPASSHIAQRTVQAKQYHTVATDGLSQPWRGRVWLNPPYAAHLVGRFVDKLCEHHGSGEVSEAILLVNNATDTGWFQRAAASCAAISFPLGRIKYLNEDQQPINTPLQGQAFLYFGANSAGFSARFREFGFCFGRWP